MSEQGHGAQRGGGWWKKRNGNLVLSYLDLRSLVGFLGLSLPFFCYFGAVFMGDPAYYDTISMYYYSSVRDLFVAIVAAMGLFLVTYGGYDRRDKVISTVAGLGALGVCLFPCEYPVEGPPQGFFRLPPGTSNVVHLSSAGTFFLFLALMSLFLFTASDGVVKKGSPKARRNLTYRVTGGLIVATLVTIGALVAKIPETALRESGALFWLESFMLLCFGVSWIVKGAAMHRFAVRFRLAKRSIRRTLQGAAARRGGKKEKTDGAA